MLAFITAHWAAITSVVSALVVVAREVVTLTGKGAVTEAQVESILKNFGLITDPTATAPSVPTVAPVDATK